MAAPASNHSPTSVEVAQNSLLFGASVCVACMDVCVCLHIHSGVLYLQNATVRMTFDLVTPSVAVSVATGSCTRKGPKGVSCSLVIVFTVYRGGH